MLQAKRLSLQFLDEAINCANYIINRTPTEDLQGIKLEDLWSKIKPAPSPFQSGVKLSANCTSPEVDATLYRQLVGSILYLTHSRPDLSFFIGRVSSPRNYSVVMAEYAW